jgi:hypothetical protein
VGITNSRSQLPTRWRSALASSRGSEKTSSPWWTSVKKKVTDMIHIYIYTSMTRFMEFFGLW